MNIYAIRLRRFLKTLLIFAAAPLLLTACSGGGGSSTSNAVGSDEEIRIDIFSDLPIQGADLLQNGNQVEDIAQIEGSTSTIAIALGDLQLNSAVSISGAELAQIKFRDLFLESLPDDAEALLQETGTLNDVTDFDRFANALLLLVALDQDANLANGIDLSHLDFNLIEGMTLSLDVPNSRFLEEPTVQILISRLGGTFAVDPYLVISDYYERNNLGFPSKQIFKVNILTDYGEYASSYRYTIDGNIKSIQHTEPRQNEVLVQIANETFDWNNPSQLDSHTVNDDNTTVTVTYDYDMQGRLLSESYTSEDKQLTTVNSYSSQGLLQEIESTETTNQYTAVAFKELSYQDGRHTHTDVTRTHSLNSATESPTFDQLESIAFSYDEIGNISQIETDFGNDGSIDQRETFARDAMGNIETRSVQQRPFSGNDFVLVAIETFEHNDRGQITLYRFDDDADGQDDHTIEYHYNGDGFLMEQISTRFDAAGNAMSTEIMSYGYTVREETGDLRNLISPPQIRVPVGFEYQP